MRTEMKSRPGDDSETAPNKSNKAVPIVAPSWATVERIAAWSEREEAAYARGYKFASQIWQGECEDAYRRGFEDALHAIEKQDEQAHRDMTGQRLAKPYAEMELVRWDGPRREFGNPRPGDYTGGPVAWNGGGS